MRLQNLLLSAFLLLLLALWPGCALAAEGSSAASPWLLLAASGALDLIVVLVALWVRESVSRRFALQRERDKAMELAVAELRQQLASTRETYATKDELRYLDGVLDRKFDRFEGRMEEHDRQLTGMSREIGETNAGVRRLIEMIAPSNRP